MLNPSCEYCAYLIISVQYLDLRGIDLMWGLVLDLTMTSASCATGTNSVIRLNFRPSYIATSSTQKKKKREQHIFVRIDLTFTASCWFVGPFCQRCRLWWTPSPTPWPSWRQLCTPMWPCGFNLVEELAESIQYWPDMTCSPLTNSLLLKIAIYSWFTH